MQKRVLEAARPASLIEGVSEGHQLTHDRDLALVGEHEGKDQGMHEGSQDGGLAGHEDTAAGRRQSQEHTRRKDEKEQNDSEHLYFYLVSEIFRMGTAGSRQSSRDNHLQPPPLHVLSALLPHIPAQAARVFRREFLGALGAGKERQRLEQLR